MELSKKNKLFEDPRDIQIIILIILNFAGLYKNIFGHTLYHVLLVPLLSVIVQYYFDNHFKRNFNFKSPLISGLSLALLFKTNSLFLWTLVPVVTISSKFILRSKGRHFFNPTNFGIVFMLIFFNDQTWVNLAGFGREIYLLAFTLFLGSFVTIRSSRFDVPLIYLSFTFSFLLLRTLWLGDPIEILFHKMENVSLLIFSFLMISDPKTTPDHRMGRVLFCFFVALLAHILQNFLYIREAHFYALFFISILNPFINSFIPGSKFSWTSKTVLAN